MRFLIVDDDEGDRRRLVSELRKGFPDALMFEITQRADFEKIVAADRFDAVFTEYRLHWTDGLTLLSTLKNLFPHRPVVWVSRGVDLPTVVAGMKSGLSDYVAKTDLHCLPKVVEESLRKAEAAEQTVQTIENLDMTVERYRAISELTSACSYYLHMTPQGMVSFDWVSETFTQIAGYTLQEINSGADWLRLLHPDDVADALQRQDYWRAGQPDMREFRLITPGGQELWVRDLSRPVGDQAPDGVIRVYGAMLDITQRKRQEELSPDAQQLEVIRRLAGGIAHDLNNFLQVICVYSDLLLGRIGHRSPLRRYVQEIVNVADQSAVLARQVMAISRRQLPKPSVFNLRILIRHITPLLQQLLGDDIEFVATVEPLLGWVNADPGEIGQVIANLVLNAGDDMSQGGRLTLTAANVKFDNATASQQAGVTPGSYVRVSVCRSGGTMDAETSSDDPTPPCSDLEPGKATRPGLSIAEVIISQSGGHITMQPTEGLGTTFEVYLPQVAAPPDLVTADASDDSRGHDSDTIP